MSISTLLLGKMRLREGRMTCLSSIFRLLFLMAETEVDGGRGKQDGNCRLQVSLDTEAVKHGTILAVTLSVNCLAGIPKFVDWDERSAWNDDSTSEMHSSPIFTDRNKAIHNGNSHLE